MPTFNSATVSVGAVTKKSDYDRVMDNSIIGGRGASGMPVKTFYSTATFLSTVRLDSFISRTSTAGVGVGAGKVGQSATASTTVFVTKIIAIGNWNMNTTPSSTVTLGIPWQKWRTIQVLIHPDVAYQAVYSLWDLEVGAGQPHNTTGYWAHASGTVATDIVLRRIATGVFDNNNFTSTSNRGYILLGYEK